MKGAIIGLVVGGVGGFIMGCLLMSDGNVGSLILGIVMAMLVVVVLGGVVILLAGVLTRKQTQDSHRQQQSYPPTPYIMLGGPSQPEPSFGGSSSYRQLPMLGNKQQVEYEDF